MTIIKVFLLDKHIDGAFTVANALKRARSLAGGRRTQFVRRGDRLGYKGPYGFAYIYEAAAKKTEEENRADTTRGSKL